MKLKREKITELLESLARYGKSLIPSEEDGVSKFVPYKDSAGFDPQLVNTVMPPKDALFPQTQKMYKFKTGKGASVEEIVEAEEQIIFGIRPCDVRSFVCLDKVFLTKTYEDSFYARKRKKLTLIAIGCVKSKPTCFCESMGVAMNGAPSADVFLVPTEEGWNVLCQSEKGKKLIEEIGIFEDGECQPQEPESLSLKVNMDGVAEKLEGMFEHQIWDEAYKPCLNCGTCTFVCPTCFCFEMIPELRKNEGTKSRYWDSCMYPEYTRMAGGHNPRPTGKERVRNRYMHKLSFFNQRYGIGLCVGCGRCIDKCPVGMDITGIIDFVGEVE